MNEEILKNVINIRARFSIVLASEPSLLCRQLITDGGGEWLCPIVEETLTSDKYISVFLISILYIYVCVCIYIYMKFE